MKNLILLTSSICFFFCFALESHSNPREKRREKEKMEITVLVHYKIIKPEVRIRPDAGAKVYLFYDLTPTDGYLYEFGGMYITDTGERIFADQSALIGLNGKVKVDAIHKNKPVKIIVESAFYSGEYRGGHIGKLMNSQSIELFFDVKK